MSTPESEYATNYIASAIRRGLGPTAGLREYRAGGGTIRTQTWFRHFNVVREAVAKRDLVGNAPLGSRPARAERATWITPRQRGYLYQVEAFVRPRGTSEVYSSYTSFRSQQLVTYGAALDGALAAHVEGAELYDEEVMGGVVTGVYELVGE